MTVEIQQQRILYQGNGTATAFSFDFTVYAPAQIRVVTADAEGKETERILGTDFSVSLAEGGGTVTYPLPNSATPPLGQGEKLVIISAIPSTQESSFPNNTPYYQEQIEGGMDKNVRLIQQLESSLARAVILPETSDETPQEIVGDLLEARDEAVDAAARADGAATNAANAAMSANGDAALAESSASRSCQCADRAEDARDVAIAQAEAINVAMAAKLMQVNAAINDGRAELNGLAVIELDKVNTIVATNKDDQQAAMELARKWAENPEDVPVRSDQETGEQEYSAYHWSRKASKISIPAPTEILRGAIRVGAGLHLTEEDRLNVDVATETTRGIGRVATAEEVASGVTGANGPAWVRVEDLAAYVATHRYELCEFYAFRHPTLRPGFQPAHGGVIANAATLYPKAWAYLQTEEGQKLCITESQWQNMVNAVWHTNADGSRVGWNGIGGAPFYVQDTANGTLRLPDLRGMYVEAAGFDSLGVGGCHGDAVRRVQGSTGWVAGYPSDSASGAIYSAATGSATSNSPEGARLRTFNFDNNRVAPTALKNQPRAWGSLACVYLGLPAS